MKDNLEIISSFGLQVEEIEPTVYKVLNPDLVVNIDKLQWALNECVLIASLELSTEKLETGIYTMLANVYYILLDYTNRELSYKYDDKATEEFGRTLYKPYKYNPSPDCGIDTIYREGEI